ncbi:hypothetical protein ACIBQ1_34500 [Nonomuraea sp. NPDC050153]
MAPGVVAGPAGPLVPSAGAVGTDPEVFRRLIGLPAVDPEALLAGVARLG